VRWSRLSTLGLGNYVMPGSRLSSSLYWSQAVSKPLTVIPPTSTLFMQQVDILNSRSMGRLNGETKYEKRDDEGEREESLYLKRPDSRQGRGDRTRARYSSAKKKSNNRNFFEY